MIMIMFYPRWFLNILFLFVTFSEDCEKLLRKPEAIGPMRKINFGRWKAKVFKSLDALIDYISFGSLTLKEVSDIIHL